MEPKKEGKKRRHSAAIVFKHPAWNDLHAVRPNEPAYLQMNYRGWDAGWGGEEGGETEMS